MSTSSSSTSIVCQRCGDKSKWFKHHSYFLGTIEILCTECIINLHAKSLCPICFAFHENLDELVTSNVVVSCVRCQSSSHVTCIGSDPSAPYLCVMCVNMNSPLLILGDFNGGKVVDKKAMKVLLAASEISLNSMKKAAVAAKMKVEARVKEAINTRKLAKKAVEYAENLYRKS